MVFISRKRKKFSGLRPGELRKAGYYWVKWSFDFPMHTEGPIWRVAEYVSALECWALPADTRTYYDKDFLEIDEREISRTGWGWLHWWFFGLLVFGCVGFVFNIYKLIISIIK